MARGKGKYAHVKKGPALDLKDGYNYKSGWERDFARFLTLMRTMGAIEGYAYEPQRFSFKEHYNSNPMFYTPDFAVRYNQILSDEMHAILSDIFEHVCPARTIFFEVKGRELPSDRSKWKRFRKHSGYPLEVVKREKLLKIQKAFQPLIPTWESRINAY